MINSYKTRMAALGSYDGEYKRRHAQKIMDASWKRDAATKPVYVKWVDSGLPEVNDDDIPVYAKFNVKSYHNITGDEVAYLLQFRLEDMMNNTNIRVGSYVQIKNEMDEPEWWLIVHYDDRSQFRQFSILKCTWVYKWVSRVNGNRIIYSCLGAPRKQSSYNSGVWLDYTTQTAENQEVLWLPTNNDTKTILYDTKILKSSPGRYPPIRWTITKIEDTDTEGISKFTMAQDQFDPSKDNVDLMVANYWDNAIEPKDIKHEEKQASSDLDITYSGTPTVRAGGGFKKFVLKSILNGEQTDPTDDVKWIVDFGNDSDKLETSIENNVLRVKCKPDYSLIGSVFTITALCAGSSKSVVVEVISL